MLSLKGFLGLDGSGWELGFKSAESVAHKFTHNMEHHLKGALVGVFGVEAVKEAYARTIEYGEKIYDTSQRLAIGTDAVQEWDYAVRGSGASAEAASNFFEKLAESREKALSGDKDKSAAFKRFGISESDLRSDKRINEIGLAVGNAVKEGDAQKLIGSLREIGGKGAGELVAAFKSGMQGQFDQAHAIGAIISPEDVTQLKLAGDRVFDLGRKITGELAPAIVVVSKTMRVLFEPLFALFDSSKKALAEFIKTGNVFSSIFAGNKAWDASIAAMNAKDREEREKIEKAKTGGEGHTGQDEEKRLQKNKEDSEKESIKRASEQIKMQERLFDLVNKNNRESMSDNEKVNDMIKERNELLKSQSLEDQIKAETLRGEINKAVLGNTKGGNKLQLTSNQQAGAAVLYAPLMENEIKRNTAAIKENTDALKRHDGTNPFSGQSGDGEGGIY